MKHYEKVPVILVGNKMDMESEGEVSSNEGRCLAEECGYLFIQTSSKSEIMVDQLFAEILRYMTYAAHPDKDDPCSRTSWMLETGNLVPASDEYPNLWRWDSRQCCPSDGGSQN